MKTALLKDIFREIRYSLARFISIMLMISLGVFVYSGLKGAAPLMRNTLDDFTAKTNMADLNVETLFGLERKDVSLLLSVPDIEKAEFHYSLELNTVASDLLVQIQSLPAELSIPYITQGRYPQKANEILLDDSLYAKGYQLGQTISFKKEINKLRFQLEDKEDALHRYQFKIVGFCYHPEFIHPGLKNEAGNGLGKIDSFAFVSEKNFNLENYQLARIKLRSTHNMVSENPVYKNITAASKDKISDLLSNRPKIRLRDLRKEAMEKIRENEEKLTDAQKQLDDAQAQLNTAEQQLKDGEQLLSSQKNILASQKKTAEAEIQVAERQLLAAKNTLDSGERTYLEKKLELEIAKLDYNRGYQAIEEAKSQLKQQETNLRSNYQNIVSGISQIDTALLEIDTAEKQLLSALARMGIPTEDFKRKVTAAVKSNQTALLQAMGEAAINYADILRNRQKLLSQKSDLIENKAKVEAGLERIAPEASKLAANETRLQQAKTELEAGESSLQSAKFELDKGRREYDTGLTRLKASKLTLDRELQQANRKIADAENELKIARQKYEDGKKSFEDKEIEANEKIADGKKKINDAKKVIKALKESTYNVQTREDNSHYFLYYDSAKRMDFLSDIFPVFFYLIAMLVCLSAMTRMAEEHRGQIGTLKALGYGTWDIAKKYFYYGLFSSFIGGIIGILFGQPILSKVVYSAYNDTFIIKKPLFRIFWQYNIFSVLIGIVCTAFVALFVVNKHLRQNASALMRPKAPKSGTKIALERITFVWKRMSFLQKVTARNMFRYKARMLMTIMGISGCTALVFLGFALRDSVSHLLPVQFGELTRYEYLAIYDEDLSESAAKDFRKYLNTSTKIAKYSNLYLEKANWKKTGMANQNIQIIVPQNPVDFVKLQTLRLPGNPEKIIPFPKEGAILTNKLAKLAKVNVGDALEITDVDNKKLRIPIVAISENYLGHYIYMSRDYYIRLFGKNPVWNAKAIKLSPNDNSITGDALVSKLLDFDVVLSVTETNFASAAQSLESLDIVVGIMILLSSVLAFVVLYNLSNINISERMRELSTIKVLGFFPKELTAYVYRETFSLSIIGIGIGYILGILLHKMILEVIVPDAFQLYPKIFPLTYVISAVMTLLFTVIVMVFVHYRLKHIDMVEALKSYE